MPTVSVLHQASFTSREELLQSLDRLQAQPSGPGWPREGLVLRCSHAFSRQELQRNVAKSVRVGHVRLDHENLSPTGGPARCCRRPKADRENSETPAMRGLPNPSSLTGIILRGTIQGLPAGGLRTWKDNGHLPTGLHPS